MYYDNLFQSDIVRAENDSKLYKVYFCYFWVFAYIMASNTS